MQCRTGLMLLTAALPRRHVLAAIHAAVIVAVRAAIALHVVTLVLALLAASLGLSMLRMLAVLGMAGMVLHLAHVVALMRVACRRGLRGCGRRDEQRHRGEKAVLVHV
jgi:hypothetical protein